MHIALEKENEIPEIDGRTSIVIQQLEDGAEIPDGAIQVNLDDLPSRDDRWRWKLDGDKVVVDGAKEEPGTMKKTKKKARQRGLLFDAVSALLSGNQSQIDQIKDEWAKS